MSKELFFVDNSMEFVHYPSIEQFRHAVAAVRNGQFPAEQLPTVTFHGTVKLHGTNAGVGYSPEVGLWAQSRNQVLSDDKPDNCGWRAFVSSHKDLFQALCLVVWMQAKLAQAEVRTVCLFGEWCGKGIQSGVAISKLPPMFVLFDACYVTVDGQHHFVSLPILPPTAAQEQVYSIHNFPTFSLAVDFNHPEAAQKELERLTTEVEKQCPVGAALGAKGCGEGIVWRCSEAEFLSKLAYQEPGVGPLRFKVKGEEHAVTKTAAPAAVDPAHLASVGAFVTASVTEGRLRQAIEQVFQSQGEKPSLPKTGAFLAWVRGDIYKEETDTMKASNLTEKDVEKEIDKAARTWFLRYVKGL